MLYHLKLVVFLVFCDDVVFHMRPKANKHKKAEVRILWIEVRIHSQLYYI